MDFLAGFNAMDRHFVEAEPEKNVPLLMGLLNVWYSNFLGADTHAVLPYSQYLHRFPAYLQQLTMESNGKSVRRDGSPVTYETGEVFWGEPGTNGQHAFYQLIHQGTRMVPADFIAFANPRGRWAMAMLTCTSCSCRTSSRRPRPWAFGKTSEEVRAEGTPEAIVSARVFTGNRPTTSIMAPALTPSVLGQLIALYEHITSWRVLCGASTPSTSGASSWARSWPSRSSPRSRARPRPWMRRISRPALSSSTTARIARSSLWLL